MTPSGILVGWILSSSLDSDPWISDIFISIAAGTFLYVAICEIMMPEFSEERKMERKMHESQLEKNLNCENSCDTECESKKEDHEEMGKMMSLLIGFTMMSILAIWS